MPRQAEQGFSIFHTGQSWPFCNLSESVRRACEPHHFSFSLTIKGYSSQVLQLKYARDRQHHQSQEFKKEIHFPLKTRKMCKFLAKVYENTHFGYLIAAPLLIHLPVSAVEITIDNRSILFRRQLS